MLKRRAKYCLRLFLLIILLLVLCENYLCIGRGRYPGIKLSSLKRQDLCCKSPAEQVCCWIEQSCSVKSWETENVLETADDLGKRPTPYVMNPRKKILAVGCSYTFGIGVKDHETYLWRAGEKWRDVRIDNFADPGYGTVQCRARLEVLLKNSIALDEAKRSYCGSEFPVHYDMIFYGLIGDHLKRNGYLRWNVDSDNNFVLFPRAENSQDGVLYHGSETIWWPVDNLFRTAVCFRNLYLRFLERKFNADIDWLHLDKMTTGQRNNPQIKERLELFNGVLSEMLELSHNYGAEFYVLHLDGNMDNLIDPALKNRGLHSVDISFPFIGKDEYYVLPHCAGHPNAIVHKEWSENLVKQMKGII